MPSRGVRPYSSCILCRDVDANCYKLARSIVYYVVDINSVAVFKKRLDKLWADQNVMFDWTADITGTGDRSEYIVESD